MTKGSVSSAPIQFIANRPFLYFLMAPNSVVAMGRYVGDDPTYVSSSAASA